MGDILRAFETGREFDAEFPNGTKLTGINTDDDLRRAKELMLARIEAIEYWVAPISDPRFPLNTGPPAL
ncbi:hypothetical protein [Variovorax sp. UMC13]|uniref:hypothetical protein n=1 Tax=Variovorax sp. UMC13 TaxID=1862326 RepID=UPI0016033360|nr:hypothetical protein [Variovorax sp. UMC13]